MSLYRKTQKEGMNLYGVELVAEDENPFKKPCLISLAAQHDLRHNNGIMTRGGMRFARVRTRLDNASCILAEDMDVDFFTQDMTSERYVDLDVDIIPYLEAILAAQPSLDELSKHFRNINIVSYCNGDERVNKMIRSIRSRLEEVGYSLEEINGVLKNMAVFAFAKDSEIDPSVTSYTFADALDEETGDPENISSALQKALDDGSPSGIYIEKHGTKSKIIFAGDGIHSIDYMDKEGVIPCAVASLVTGAIENSRENSKKDQLVEYDADEELTRVERIITSFKEGKTQEEILSEIDSGVYADVPRASELELFLEQKTDEIADVLSKINIPEEDRRGMYRNTRGRFLRLARDVFSKDEMEYIITDKGKLEISPERIVSDKGRKQMLAFLSDFGRIQPDIKLGAQIDELDLSFLDKIDENNPKCRIIREMIEAKKEKADRCNQETKGIHEDSVKVNDVIGRMMEIGSDRKIGQLILKYNKDMFAQWSVPKEDVDKINDALEQER